MLATAWTTPQLPEIRSEIVTAGLKWPPETWPSESARIGDGREVGRALWGLGSSRPINQGKSCSLTGHAGDADAKGEGGVHAPRGALGELRNDLLVRVDLRVGARRALIAREVRVVVLLVERKGHRRAAA